MKLQTKVFYFLKANILNIKSIKFRGEKIYCPLCKFKASKFLNSPDSHRKNVRCPRCNSLERHRAQWLLGVEELIKTYGAQEFKVLHFAPEFCLSRKFSEIKNCSYKTADYSKTAGADFCIDIQKTGIPSESYDVIICNHVLEHVENDSSAIAELHRILKVNGTAFVQVPIDINRNNTFEDKDVILPVDREKHFGQDDHLRIYGMDFINRLTAAGFKVKCIEFWKQLNSEQITYYGLTENEPVYICYK